MRVDVWSDVVCPFCYIGKKRLEQLGIRTHDQPRVRFQFQYLQQLLRFAMQGDRLQVFVCLQQVMQRHTITA